MHFFLHNFTNNQHILSSILLYEEEKLRDLGNFVPFEENIYSSQESDESTKRGGEEEEEFSKSCPAALIITTTGAILS